MCYNFDVVIYSFTVHLWKVGCLLCLMLLEDGTHEKSEFGKKQKRQRAPNSRVSMPFTVTSCFFLSDVFIYVLVVPWVIYQIMKMYLLLNAKSYLTNKLPDKEKQLLDWKPFTFVVVCCCINPPFAPSPATMLWNIFCMFFLGPVLLAVLVQLFLQFWTDFQN